MTLLKDTIGMRFLFNRHLISIEELYNENTILCKDLETGASLSIPWSELVARNTKIYNDNDDPEYFI